MTISSNGQPDVWGDMESPEKEKQESDHFEDVAVEESRVKDAIDPIASKKLDRKFDLHIIPWLFGIWLLAFIDRSNIGNAKIDGLTEDLNLQGNKFNIALVVFYVPYILVDVPSNWLVKVSLSLNKQQDCTKSTSA